MKLETLLCKDLFLSSTVELFMIEGFKHNELNQFCDARIISSNARSKIKIKFLADTSLR